MKKTTLILLVFTLILSFSSVSLAGSETEQPDATAIPCEEESDDNKSCLTTGNISISPNGMLEATDRQVEYWNSIVRNDPVTYPSKATWMPLSPFTYYSQEYTYSCGPACVKMALKYITGTTYSESTVRSGCNCTTSGTYTSDMVTYINNEQSDHTYIARYNRSKITMNNNFYSAIVTYDVPPLVGVAFSTSDGWPFTTSGHELVIYSVKSDKSEYAICDPWGGYGSTTKWYDKTDDDLYDAYDAINAGYMY